MSFLPSREAELVTWTGNFNAIIQSNPDPCGLTLDQLTAYQTAQEAFAAAYLTSQHPSTRTPDAISQKDVSKREIIALSREYAAICQAAPGMTDPLRVQLGITVRSSEPSPVPVPADPPSVDLVSVQGHTIRLRLHNGDSTRRAKPAGVQGATVFSYVGEQPPANLSDWKFEGSSTRTKVVIQVPSMVAPGSKIWMCAFWYNARAKSGPACTPISTNVGFGGVSQAA